MSVTIEQVARAAGVSRGTVDRVLHNRGRVDQEVAARVLEAARELNYIPRKRKQPQSGGQQEILIGVITQLAKAPFMVEVNRGIREAKESLEARGVRILSKDLVSVDEEEQEKAIEELAAQGIQGLAIMPVDSSLVRNKINHLTREQGIPVVTFNSDIVGTGRCCFVGLDNRRSGMTAAGLMGMMTGGEGKVLIITGFFSNNVNNARVDGFLEEARKSFPGMEVVGVQGSFDDAIEVERIITKALDTYPDLAGILVVSSGQSGIKRGLESRGDFKKRPYIIAYDLTPQTAELLIHDSIDFLIDQEGYVQGAQPPELLADMIQRGKMPESEFLYTDINIRTKYNI